MVIDGSGGTSIRNLVYSVIRNGTAANKFGGTTVSYAPTDDIQGGCAGLFRILHLMKGLTELRRCAEFVLCNLLLGFVHLSAAPVAGNDQEISGRGWLLCSGVLLVILYA